MNLDPTLFPHVNGQPNLSAQGGFALAYLRPDDLHMTLLFNHVTKEFAVAYVKNRQWCRDAAAEGCVFVYLPAVSLEGLIQ